MTILTFTCETITPMFLAGADGVTPELRAPSIKGALRFWWRALNGHLSLDDLRKKEGELFGGAGDKAANRSQLIIQVPFEKVSVDAQSPLVPHKGMFQKAISTRETFEVRLMFRDGALKDKFRALFVLTCLLGGFGKRVRRGMGSVRILQENDQDFTMPETLDDLFKHIEVLSNHFAIKPSGIYNNFSGRMGLYPWVQQIEIGKNNRGDLLKHISQKTHEFKFNKDNQYSYEPSLGHAFKGRFASPIYTSTLLVQGRLMPVITTLNTVPDRSQRDIDPVLQQEFRKSIL
ncbi:MAG: type III-B CRISPR module RAMP protein Cmr1 [Saprospiraceae bacterium]